MKSFRQFLLTEKTSRSKFWLVFDLPIDPADNPLVWDQLLAGKLKGVSGISNDDRIVAGFMGVGRNAILVIDAERCLAANKGIRAMSWKPDDMLADNMKALARVFNRTEINKYYYKDMLTRIFGYIGLWSGKISPSLVSAYSWEGAGQWVGGEITKPINSVVDLAEAIRHGINKTTLIKQYVKDGFNELDEKYGWETFIRGAMERIHATYRSESEWIVDQPELIVPQGSTLIVGTRPNLEKEPHPVFGSSYDRRDYTNYKTWQNDVERLRKRYTVRLVPLDKFDNYRKNVRHY